VYADAVHKYKMVSEDAITEILYTAPQSKQEQGEPVAWHVQEWSGTGKKFLTFDAPPETPSLRDEVVNPVWKPLVFADTTPQQRKPLTDEQKLALLKKHFNSVTVPDWFDALLMDIEAAHGIKE